MKTCLLCPNPIPATIIIDGKKRNLKNRKYCFDCSPFGEHNTKALRNEPKSTTHKLCLRCNTVKELSDFYRRRHNTEPSPYCKPCTNSQTTERQKALKQQAIEYKGGACCICGYSKYNGSLEFHHIDPSQKEFGIGNAKLTAFKKIIPELDKCILLCRNCHSEVHGGIIEVPVARIEPAFSAPITLVRLEGECGYTGK
jgi:hypothetical protein